MIMTLNFTKNSFCGTSYYFVGFTDGGLPKPVELETKRVHFDGQDMQDCIKNAISYMENRLGGFEMVKFKDTMKDAKNYILSKTGFGEF